MDLKLNRFRTQFSILNSLESQFSEPHKNSHFAWKPESTHTCRLAKSQKQFCSTKSEILTFSSKVGFVPLQLWQKSSNGAKTFFNLVVNTWLHFCRPTHFVWEIHSSNNYSSIILLYNWQLLITSTNFKSEMMGKLDERLLLFCRQNETRARSTQPNPRLQSRC